MILLFIDSFIKSVKNIARHTSCFPDLHRYDSFFFNQATASMAKCMGTDLQVQVADDCVQLHGGWGYMWEYPVCRALADGRVQKIYGGTNEIMKELISREVAK